MAVVSMKELLEAGVHFGHRTRRWNPKMRPYIFTERSGVHIIDLQQTTGPARKCSANRARYSLQRWHCPLCGHQAPSASNDSSEADRCGMPYINHRWLGGTLTNWQTIQQRIRHLLDLERRMDSGEFRNLTKKERLTIQREVDKLNERIGGLKTLRKVPDLLFIVDTSMEDLAVAEASRLKIPMVGMVGYQCRSNPIDYVIPSNDDAIRSVKLIVKVIADAAEEGLRIREVDAADIGQVSR